MWHPNQPSSRDQKVCVCLTFALPLSRRLGGLHGRGGGRRRHVVRVGVDEGFLVDGRVGRVVVAGRGRRAVRVRVGGALQRDGTLLLESVPGRGVVEEIRRRGRVACVWISDELRLDNTTF